MAAVHQNAIGSSSALFQCRQGLFLGRWEVRLLVHRVGPVDVGPHPGQPSHLLFGQSFLGGELGSVPIGDAHAGVDVLMGVMLHILVDLIQPGVPVGIPSGAGSR